MPVNVIKIQLENDFITVSKEVAGCELRVADWRLGIIS